VLKKSLFFTISLSTRVRGTFFMILNGNNRRDLSPTIRLCYPIDFIFVKFCSRSNSSFRSNFPSRRSTLWLMTKTLVSGSSVFIILSKLSIPSVSRLESNTSSSISKFVLAEFFILAICLQANNKARSILDFSPSEKEE